MSAPRLTVRVSELLVADAPGQLVAIGLGSCVAVVVHDAGARIGGLAHVLLPTAGNSRTVDRPGRYAHTAVPALIERMIARGARVPAIGARLVGGASMFSSLTPPGTIQMGDRNVVAVREALHRHGIRLLSEAVGGDYGRTAELDLETGRLTVRAYQREPIVL